MGTGVMESNVRRRGPVKAVILCTCSLLLMVVGSLVRGFSALDAWFITFAGVITLVT